MLDEYKKNINYAEISLTDKCNLKCVYCMPEDKVYDSDIINDTLLFSDYKFIINGLAQVGINKIDFTGGEPLLYPQLVELIKYTTFDCNIDDVSITTNGIGLHEIAYELKQSGLKSVNISLDSLKSYKYKAITRGANLNYVLKSINRCLDLGIKVNINCVIIKKFNDDEIYDFIDMTNYYPVDIRFVELLPFGEGEYLYENGYFNLTKFINETDLLYKIQDEEELNIDLYKIKYAKGRIGIITNVSANVCNRIIITPSGSVKLEVYSNEHVDIKEYLNKPMIFKEVLREIMTKIIDNNKLSEMEF